MTHRLFAITLLTYALATPPLTGCLEKPNDNPDGGVGRDVNVPRDSAPTDAAPPDDGGSTTTCNVDDLVEQLDCDTGDKCTLLSSTEVGCHPSGVALAYASCDSTTLPESRCGPGDLCSDAHDPGVPRCLPFCLTKGLFCPEGGICALDSVYAGVSLCLEDAYCDPVGPVGTPTCTNGNGCYLASDGLTYCLENGGTLPLGAPCAGLDCDSGLSCFGPEGDGECLPVCAFGNDTCDASGLGLFCQPLSDDWGVCI